MKQKVVGLVKIIGKWWSNETYAEEILACYKPLVSKLIKLYGPIQYSLNAECKSGRYSTYRPEVHVSFVGYVDQRNQGRIRMLEDCLREMPVEKFINIIQPVITLEPRIVRTGEIVEIPVMDAESQ